MRFVFLGHARGVLLWYFVVLFRKSIGASSLVVL